jgi:hypothetical protein
VERRGDEPADPAAERAVELASEEAGLITDPHRAIDWLSTYPELVALALGEPVGGGPAEGPVSGGPVSPGAGG